MEAAVEHIERLLADSSEPLSFILFIREGIEPLPPVHLKIDSSHYKRRQIIVPAMEHEFRHGLQHILSK